MGDVCDTRLAQLLEAVRERIGQPARTFSHSCDVMVVEALLYWPEKEFARLAKGLADQAPEGNAALDAIAVVAAKCRENLEARWGVAPSHTAAIELLMAPVVVQLANIWFSTAEARIAMRAVIAKLRHGSKQDRHKGLDDISDR